MTQFIIPLLLVGAAILMFRRRPSAKDLPTLESRCNTEFVILLLSIKNINTSEQYDDCDINVEVFYNYWHDSVGVNFFNQCMLRLEDALLEKEYFKNKHA